MKPVLVILVAIGAFTVYHNMHKNTETQASTQTVEEAYDKLQQVENTPKLVDKKGGLLISKDGYGKSVEGAPTVAIYMDFLCPGCGNLHRQLDEDLQKMVDAGQINLDLHFMAFMDKWSTDDYSSRAANAAIYLAEHDSDPSHLITFLEKMYAEDFQPEESSNYKSVSDDQIKEQMIASGVSEDVADKAFGRDYQDWRHRHLYAEALRTVEHVRNLQRQHDHPNGDHQRQVLGYEPVEHCAGDH